MKERTHILKCFKSLLNSGDGSVMLEFLLVMPIYLVLFGGLFTIGELLVLNNRVSTTERNLTFSQLPQVNSVAKEGMPWNTFKSSLFGGDCWGYVANDNGDYLNGSQGENEYVHRGVVAVNLLGEDGLLTRSPWGTCVGGWTYVRNIRMPSFIEGMYHAVNVFNGDPVKKTDFALGSHRGDGDDFTGCFYTLRCNTVCNVYCATDYQQDRAWMRQLQTKTTTTQDKGYSYVYYVHENDSYPSFYGDCSRALAYDYLFSDAGSSPSVSSGNDGATDYVRIFGNFFTN